MHTSHVKLKTLYILITLCTVSFFDSVHAITPENFLNRAQQLYQQGRLQEAEYFTGRARRAQKDNTPLPEADYLEALISFASGRVARGLNSADRYLEVKKDPFVAYILASYYVRSGNYESAMPYLKLAQSADVDFNKQPLNYELSNFDSKDRCNLELLEASPENRAFRDPEQYASLPGRRIAGLEVLYARYLLKVINKQQSDLPKTNNPLVDLLKSASIQSHEICMQLENESEPNLYRLYRNRNQLASNRVSMDYSFAEFLYSHEKYLEGLHVLRRGFASISQNDMKTKARYLRAFERMYRSLNRRKDADSADSLATLIEKYYRSDLDFLKTQLVKTAGQNLKNRESILLLMDLNAHRADLLTKYQKALANLDREQQSAELLFVYRDRYNY